LVHSEQFTEDELKSLAQLYGLIVEVSNRRHPTVEAMLKDPLWRRVVALAGDSTGRFARRGIGTSRVGEEVFNRLHQHVNTGKLGRVFTQDSTFRCFADDPCRVCKPDGAFISFETLPESDYEPDGFCTTVPDLMWEVVSPNDLAYELDAKVDEWLAAGVKVTWVFHPQNRTVHILRERDTLGEPSLLPGFSASVRELFGRPSRATVS
jgi:Uma2 family endonuclease